MKKFPAFIVLVSIAQFSQAESRSITTMTADGVTVHGDMYLSPGRGTNAPLILLFHQGASNGRAEYEPLAPRLLEHGFHLLSIDQRRGGDRFGGINRTLAGVVDTEYSYCDVMPDLEAALAYARNAGYTGPTVAWGSSYSAALIFKLARDNTDEIDAVIGFSPASGEPMAGCTPEMFSGDVDQPVLALRPKREMQIPTVAVQMAMFETQGHETYVADPAVHGSSMLNEVRVGQPVEETWRIVLDFLDRALAANQ